MRWRLYPRAGHAYRLPHAFVGYEVSDAMRVVV
jgi:hypothetical protein